mmetsp:Transcript_77090/g.170203  ORF Transcript_77090/g.170203 Transcript_77090/m.170203 type:complete len:228 (-) Transcript_77090:477-1160(-)
MSLLTFDVEIPIEQSEKVQAQNTTASWGHWQLLINGCNGHLATADLAICKEGVADDCLLNARPGSLFPSPIWLAIEASLEEVLHYRLLHYGVVASCVHDEAQRSTANLQLDSDDTGRCFESVIAHRSQQVNSSFCSTSLWLRGNWWRLAVFEWILFLLLLLLLRLLLLLLWRFDLRRRLLASSLNCFQSLALQKFQQGLTIYTALGVEAQFIELSSQVAGLQGSQLF